MDLYRDSKLVRRFIVVEGISHYYGDICPLRELVALKKEYRYRLLLDDGMATGVLGKTGRGTFEHFGVDLNEIDIMCGTLDHTMASVGGWCIGNEKAVVDHQRLSGAGYCFSASSPPYCSAAAMTAFSLLQRNGAALTAVLRQNSQSMHTALHEQLKGLGVTINGRVAGAAPSPTIAAAAADLKSGDDDQTVSPVLHIRLARAIDPSRKIDRRLIGSIARTVWSAGQCVRCSAVVAFGFSRGSISFVAVCCVSDCQLIETHGIAVVAPKYVESKAPEPSIRVFVTSEHSPAQIERTAKAIRTAFRSCYRVLLSNSEDELTVLQSAATAEPVPLSSPVSRVGTGAAIDLKLDTKSQPPTISLTATGSAGSGGAAASVGSDWRVSESSIAAAQALTERIAWVCRMPPTALLCSVSNRSLF